MGSGVSTSVTEVNIRKPISTYRSLFDFKKLQSVTIVHSGITRFPANMLHELSCLPPIVHTLTDLDLSYNALEAIPVELLCLVGLRRLDLSHNKIRALPDNFCVLKNMERLNLSRNELLRLPTNITNMPMLKSIMFHKNRITFIPGDIGHLENLKEMTLHDNPLEKAVISLSSIPKVQAWCREHPGDEEYKESIVALQRSIQVSSGLMATRSPELSAFRTLLARPEHVKVFYAFMKKEFSTESLEFYIMSEHFRIRFNNDYPYTNWELYTEADKIYRNFILDAKDGKRDVINISNDIRAKIDHAFIHSRKAPQGLPTEVTQWIFVPASVAILKLMYNDTFKRFIETPEGAAIWNNYDKTTEQKLNISVSQVMKLLEHHQKEKKKDAELSAVDNEANPFL